MSACRSLIAVAIAAAFFILPLSISRPVFAGADLKSQWDRFSGGNKTAPQPKQEAQVQPKHETQAQPKQEASVPQPARQETAPAPQQAEKPEVNSAAKQAAGSQPQQPTQSAGQAQNPNRVQVEAEGIGATKMDALTAAWNEAVQKGVGLFMTSKTEVIDDKLTEKIVTHSRGQVNSYKELSAEKKEDGWHVLISAQIDKDILQETAAGIQSKTMSFDGSNTAAQNITKEKKKQTQKEAITSLKELIDFKNCLDYTSVIREIKKKDKIEYYVEHTVKINMEKFQQMAKSLSSVLEKICDSKRSVELITLDNNKKHIKALKDWSISDEKVSAGLKNCIINDTYTFRASGSEEIIIVNNVSTGTAYKLDKENMKLFYKLLPEYKLTFITEAGSGFDSTIGTHKLSYFQIGYIGSSNVVTILPAFNYHIGYHNNINAAVKFFQSLELTNEQLMNIKEITGRYILE